MRLLHLYILDRIKPLWLQKLVANILGFVMIYPIALHNKETVLLLSLFLAVYLYKNMQKIDSKSLASKTTGSSDTQTTIESNHTNPTQTFIAHDVAIVQLMISCFCVCLFIFTTWQIYIVQVVFGCIFIRIYDYYRPSLIGRFYNLQPNKILGSILGAILHGILSGASVMLLYYVSIKLS